MRRIKGGWSGQNGSRNNNLTYKKMAVQTSIRKMTNKQPELQALELLWKKTVATQSLYTKIDTVAGANTCGGCFRRSIADTKKSDK